MAASEHRDPARPGTAPQSAGSPKPPPAAEEFLAYSPDLRWPRIRTLRVESPEENEYVNLLSEMNWVMKHCPVKLLGRVDRREIRAIEMDQGKARLNDALHGVRHALQALFHLAGFRDYRFRVEETPSREPGILELGTTHQTTGSRPKPTLAN